MPAFTTVAAALISLLSSISSTLAQASVPIPATTATTIPFPSTTLANSDAQSFIQSSWGLSKGRIQTGASNLDFVPDPFPNNPAPRVQSNTTGPVLRVLYHAGSFSDVDDGGAQFYALWNSSGDPFRSMSVSYEVAFDTGFDWVKGGKLPGLRGGDPNGCSGGNEADGETCFSSRFMWRKNGQGEMYAYIPEDNDICDASDVKCNDEFGASVGRGEFSFASGQWNKVTMAIWLNSPVDTANGRAQLYYNDILVTDRSDLVFRTTDSLTANGLYFSTFFGGSDDSWAPPSDTHTYFRNFVLNGGSSASNLTGAKITSGASTVVGGRGSVWRGLVVVVGCAVVGAVVGV